MKIDAYVQFGGRAAEAVAFYQEHLGASAVQALPFRGSPAAAMASEAWQDKLMHFSITIGNSVLLGSDGMSGQPSSGMQGCSLALHADSADQAERVFKALAQGGSVTMPLSPSFFAERFGIVTDQFGVSWMIVYGSQS
jgi:PhnB protein